MVKEPTSTGAAKKPQAAEQKSPEKKTSTATEGKPATNGITTSQEERDEIAHYSEAWEKVWRKNHPEDWTLFRPRSR